MSVTVSNSRVDRAGRWFRDWWLAPYENPDQDVLDGHTEVLFAFRSSFTKPLKKVTVGVRQSVQREQKVLRIDEATGREILDVGQRLKRAPQIVNKLARYPTMRLSQMDDVGGCRAILEDADEVAGVIRRMRKNRWEIVRIDDYVANPKPTGYPLSMLWCGVTSG